jgi:hypothetical protein
VAAIMPILQICCFTLRASMSSSSSSSDGIVVSSSSSTSCFQHFFLNNSVTLDIIELIFGNGCPNAIFEHVFEKKEEQIR